MLRASAAFKRLSPAYKAIIGLVAPICTILGMLLALNVISPFGDDALAAGIDRTAEAATAAINVSVTSDGLAFDAAGDFDYRSGRGALNYDYSRTPGNESLTDVPVVYSPGHAYIKLAPEPRPWIHADLATAADDLAEFAEESGRDVSSGELASLGQLDFSDPSQALEQLRQVADVEEIGTKAIFRVPTRGYRGVIESEEGGERVTATAWIADDDLIRRLELQSPTLKVTMDLTEFGKPVDVNLPRKREVQELEEVLERLP